jgi:hypothetical protein
MRDFCNLIALLVLLPVTAQAEIVRTGSVAIRLSGYIHADGVIVDQSSADEVNPSTGEPLNDNRFLIRRAVLRTDLAYGIVSGAAEIEANTVRSPTVRLIVAEASARWPSDQPGEPPLVMASMGQFLIPFGFETQQRPIERLFLDASNMTRALFPGFYDLGLRVQGGWKFIRYQAAIMNGEPLGERSFPGRDPNGSKDLIGRLGIDTDVIPGLRIQAGVSGLAGTGFHQGTPSTKDVLVWRDVNEDGIVQPSEIQAEAGTAGTPSQNFKRSAVGADLRVRADVPWLGAFFGYFEAMWAVNLDRGFQIADPVAVGRDVRERGFVVGAAQEITEWALVGVRWDRYDPDADAFDQQGASLVPKDSSVSTLAFMGSVQYPPFGRLILEYDHNDNALGRGSNGAPARLANDTLTLRAQVGF